MVVVMVVFTFFVVVIVAYVVVGIGYIDVILSQQCQIRIMWCGHQITIFGLTTQELSRGAGKRNDDDDSFECGG